jgi:DNA-binding NtrC family response regulator
VLQEKQFEPVGSTQTLSVDVRFVLATNEALTLLVEQGKFRQDLFYRINVVSIRLPPLRERIGDVPLLVKHFLGKYCKEVGKQVTGFNDEAMGLLRRYPWPGNVRELENAVERAVVLCRRPVIEMDDLPETILDPDLSARLSNAGGRSGGFAGAGEIIPALRGGWNPMPLEQAMKEPERRILRAALEANDWNRQETARQLGINRTTLYKKIKQFELDEPGRN